MANHINNIFRKNTFSLCKKIYENKLAINTFGNASFFDRKEKLIYIKPSGVSIDTMKINDISVVDCKKDIVISGLKPSVDYSIHKNIYLNFKEYHSVIHTHSTFSTILAQANISPHCIGTTHADYTLSKIPITNEINIKNSYEEELNLSIIKTLKKQHFDFPFIIIKDHGSLAFGNSLEQTLDRAIALEFICKTFYFSQLIKKKNMIKKNTNTFKKFNFHYDRKNSKNKFYGQ